VKPDGPIKLVSQLLDLPLCDSDGYYCGIVDDVEFAGPRGKEELKALLVGPGAYRRRLPAWAMWLVDKLAGDRLTLVPIGNVETIGPAVVLNCPGKKLGLDRSERAAERWIPHEGAM
jgi:sporulation protein YlmC with PRC-barrel domain